MDLNEGMEKCIDTNEVLLSNIEDNENINEEDILSIGTSLVKVTRKIDKCLSGMILNTYITCLLASTSTLYVASSVFFNKSKNLAAYFICCGCIFTTILSIMRILYHTNAGQYLASEMKIYAYTLDKLHMKKSQDGSLDTIHILKQDLKDHEYSPINPFSAFSLSNSTLIGTFATILTYLIVLIQFKATEDEEKTKLLNELKYMLQTLLKNHSNITGLDENFK